MKRRELTAALFLALAGLPASTHASYRALDKHHGPVRVILVVNGEYSRYGRILVRTIRGLAHLGLIGAAPEGFGDTDPSLADYWHAAARTSSGEILSFLEDGFYSYDFKPEQRARVRSQISERLATRRDVDMIWTFGTEPTRDMFADVDDLPVLSINSSDPVGLGLVPSAEDSGKDNVYAIVQHDYFARQIRSFHACFPFKRLGAAVAEQRRSQIGEEEVRRACGEFGSTFEVECYKEQNIDPEEAFENLRAAVNTLIERKVDAVILPWIDGTDAQFREILTILTRHGIPTFTQIGEEFVARGALLGVGATNLDNYGYFAAKAIARVLEGEVPRFINQKFLPTNGLVINLKTAMQLGWKPPFGLLITVEKAFTTHSPKVR